MAPASGAVLNCERESFMPPFELPMSHIGRQRTA
jgi:hypothetical protein